MNNDEFYIKRCIELAQKALGKTYPNPLVGSVIVHNGKIIGEGYHHKAGETMQRSMQSILLKTKN
jgi:diaminohydroxyphosphoribosylaminopyrimidine deaminase/5-amino-6-(5-phosphoribosylamino)uracil reductase